MYTHTLSRLYPSSSNVLAKTSTIDHLVEIDLLAFRNNIIQVLSLDSRREHLYARRDHNESFPRNAYRKNEEYQNREDFRPDQYHSEDNRNYRHHHHRNGRYRGDQKEERIPVRRHYSRSRDHHHPHHQYTKSVQYNEEPIVSQEKLQYKEMRKGNHASKTGPKQPREKHHQPFSSAEHKPVDKETPTSIRSPGSASRHYKELSSVASKQLKDKVGSTEQQQQQPKSEKPGVKVFKEKVEGGSVVRDDKSHSEGHHRPHQYQQHQHHQHEDADRNNDDNDDSVHKKPTDESISQPEKKPPTDKEVKHPIHPTTPVSVMAAIKTEHSPITEKQESEDENAENEPIETSKPSLEGQADQAKQQPQPPASPSAPPSTKRRPTSKPADSFKQNKEHIPHHDTHKQKQQLEKHQEKSQKPSKGEQHSEGRKGKDSIVGESQQYKKPASKSYPQSQSDNDHKNENKAYHHHYEGSEERHPDDNSEHEENSRKANKNVISPVRFVSGSEKYTSSKCEKTKRLKVPP
ncbi:unnamed protein product [Heterobilharzia americana]|nr:unnamed protein product [Heterobilharzia americana]